MTKIKRSIEERTAIVEQKLADLKQTNIYRNILRILHDTDKTIPDRVEEVKNLFKVVPIMEVEEVKE